MTVCWRVIMATTVLSGSAICDSRRPAARQVAPSMYSTISASTSPKAVISSVAGGTGGGGAARPSLRATMGKVEPCQFISALARMSDFILQFTEYLLAEMIQVPVIVDRGRPGTLAAASTLDEIEESG